MSAALIRAARALLDAYGSDTPDWLRPEADALQAAIDAAKVPTLREVYVAGSYCTRAGRKAFFNQPVMAPSPAMAMDIARRRIARQGGTKIDLRCRP